jgi:hypothetical protein
MTPVTKEVQIAFKKWTWRRAVIIDSHDWQGHWIHPDKPENPNDNEFSPTVCAQCRITWDQLISLGRYKPHFNKSTNGVINVTVNLLASEKSTLPSGCQQKSMLVPPPAPPPIFDALTAS